MKKLMTAFALCAAVSAMAVDSANIVGYQTLTAGGMAYASGAPFIKIGSAGTWDLADVTVEGGCQAGTDFIQFLNEDTAVTDVMATYVDAATAAALENPALQGWWDLNIENPIALTLSAGRGFLCAFTTPSLQIRYVGEVLLGVTTVDCSDTISPMIANPTPVDLTLADVSAIGMEAGTDFIQFLNVDTAATDVMATYIDAATAAALENPALQGWWDLNIENSLDSTPWPAGAAALGGFTSTSISIVFPSPL